MNRRAFVAATPLLLAGCAGKETKPPPFHKITDELCVDRGEALIIYAEIKTTINGLRNAIARGCRAKKVDPVACVEIEDLGRQLGTIEDAFQEKILHPEVVIDVKKVVTALKLAAAIAGKLL